MASLWSLTGFDLTGRLPQLDPSTVIGISVAICGNILISLALNLQKLAHKRLEVARLSNGGNISNGKSTSGGRSLNERDEESLDDTDDDEISTETITQNTRRASQSEPLLPTVRPERYGAVDGVSPQRINLLSSPFRRKPTGAMPVDVLIPGASYSRGSAPEADGRKVEDTISETEYLKSKLWWTGFLLMNVGELGNFISYAWAPASIVAPLGTFALIANCFFAPLIMEEKFRRRDLFGILLAIIGAVTVVLSSNTSDGRLDADGLLHAIAQPPFIAYSSIYVLGVLCLSALSNGPIGQRYVFVDVGICALFGGFTVLSTKAISTLLTMQWIKIFTHPITYPVIIVLALTGVGQIRYLNRALMKFDSKIVIPSQFVLFNLSAIVGSAILYNDFKKATFYSMVTFLYGCAATFAGVVVISLGSPSGLASEERSLTGPDGEDADDDGGDAEAPSVVRPPPRRPVLLIPKDTHMHDVRRRHSAVSLIGLSNAHHLLLVHTPPRETPLQWTPGGTSSSYGRNRTMSWLGAGPNEAAASPRGLSDTRKPEPRTRATISP